MPKEFQNLSAWKDRSQELLLFLDPETININSRYQKRHKLVQEKVEAIAEEFRRGEASPKTAVLVVPSESYEYAWDIVYGSHRVAAARLAGVKIPAFNGEEMSEGERVRTALAENLLRSDPNPLERVEAILGLIEVELGLSQAKVLELLSWNHNGQRRDSVDPEEWEALKAFIESVPGGMAVATFYKRYIPLLSMDSRLSDAVRSGQLDYTKALALRKLEGEELENLLLRAIEHDLSLEDIKAEVASRKPVRQKEMAPNVALAKRLRSVKLADYDEQTRRAIVRALKKLEDLLG